MQNKSSVEIKFLRVASRQVYSTKKMLWSSSSTKTSKLLYSSRQASKTCISHNNIGKKAGCEGALVPLSGTPLPTIREIARS